MPQRSLTQALVASSSASRQEAIRAAVMTLPGMAVTTCASNRRAITDALAAHRPRLLIIDMALPGSEALVVIRWVRQAHPAVAILAVALSARQGQLAMTAGADGAALHTTTVEQLVDALACVIGRQRPGAPG